MIDVAERQLKCRFGIASMQAVDEHVPRRGR
jgi:hypothetical protein